MEPKYTYSYSNGGGIAGIVTTALKLFTVCTMATGFDDYDSLVYFLVSAIIVILGAVALSFVKNVKGTQDKSEDPDIQISLSVTSSIDHFYHPSEDRPSSAPMVHENEISDVRSIYSLRSRFNKPKIRKSFKDGALVVERTVSPLALVYLHPPTDSEGTSGKFHSFLRIFLSLKTFYICHFIHFFISMFLAPNFIYMVKSVNPNPPKLLSDPVFPILNLLIHNVGKSIGRLSHGK